MQAFLGDSAGIRTQDPYIKSVLLYRLSYGIDSFFEKRCKDITLSEIKPYVPYFFLRLYSAKAEKRMPTP
jgi:hypothetical protein